MALFSFRNRKKEEPQPQVQPQQIQGSGYGSQYASNETNYKPPVTPPPVKPPAPTTPQVPSTPDYTQYHIQQRGGQVGQQKQDIENRTENRINLEKMASDRRERTLGEIRNIQTESFNQYQNSLRKGLDLQSQTAQRQQQEAQRDVENSKYYNEQARKERMKGLEGTLASLGTLQSSALGNIGAKINMGAERQDRQQQEKLNSRIADIQDSYRLAENEAESLIQQEAANYRQQQAQLSERLDINSIDYQIISQQLRDNADQRITDIINGLNDFTYQANLEAIKAQQEDGPSVEFLSTGQPQTRQDLIWMAENPDKLAELNNRSGIQRELSPEEQANRQSTISLVDELLQSNLGPVSGVYGRTGIGTFAGSGANTKAALNQLLGRLVVDERGKLKGQGQISDRETQMLQDSVSRLNTPGLSQEAIKAELNRIKQTLGGSLSSSDQQGGNDPLGLGI